MTNKQERMVQAIAAAAAFGASHGISCIMIFMCPFRASHGVIHSLKPLN